MLLAFGAGGAGSAVWSGAHPLKPQSRQAASKIGAAAAFTGLTANMFKRWA
jgi:hypothetical protein